MTRYFSLPWALSSYLILGILVLHGGVTLGFLCDDALLIYNSQGGWFHFEKGAYQVFLAQYVLFNLLYKIFHLNPIPYHALHLALIISNAGLVFLLAQTLGLEPWKCWVAGLLALFNSGASEAYFWLSCINTVLMTGCTLAGLIFLSRWRQGSSFLWGLGYLFMIVLAPWVESKGVILPFLGLVLDLYLADRLHRQPSLFFKVWRFQVLAFSLGGLSVLGRLLMEMRHYVINFSWWHKLFLLKATITSTFFHGLNDQLWYFLNPYPPALWSNLQSLMLLGLLAIVVWVLLKMASPERRLFSLLLLFWAGASLPHVLGAAWQYRYFYFPGVFSALVVAELLGFLRRLSAGKTGILLVSLVVLAYLHLDIKAFQLSLASFSEACSIYDAGIHQIRKRLPELPHGAQLILIDFPNFIYSRQEQGPPKPEYHYYVNVYRNALPSHLRLLYGTDQFSVTYLKLASQPLGSAVPLGEPASPEQVAELLALANPKTYAFRYVGGNPPCFISWEK